MELVQGLSDRTVPEQEKDEKITLALNGQQYEDFVSASVVKDLTELSGGFAFQLTDKSGDGVPFGANDSCEVYIDGEKVITGYTQKKKGGLSTSTSMYNIQGKERTIDFIESDLSTNITYSDEESSNALERLYLNNIKKQPILTGDFSLKDVIRRTLSNINLDISVFQQDGLVLDNFTQEENIVGKCGAKAFAFCEKYARKRGVLISSTKNSNVRIQRSARSYNGLVLQLILDNETNNVEDSEFVEDYSKSFYKYTARCSQNLSLGIFDKNPTNKTVTIYNNKIRKSRQKEIVMDANSTSTLRKRLIWQKNFDLSNDTYTCKVKGFRGNNGILWYPNLLVEVNDERWGVKKRMLTKRVEWTFSNGGTFTNMTLVDPIAFSGIESYDYNFRTNEIKR